jgi:hypothetical protein
MLNIVKMVYSYKNSYYFNFIFDNGILIRCNKLIIKCRYKIIFYEYYELCCMISHTNPNIIELVSQLQYLLT